MTAEDSDQPTLHATAFVLAGPHGPVGGHGPVGILLTGASGAGKSWLALTLIERWQAAGRFAMLVADDRVALTAANGALLARPPRPLAGLIERRGVGILAVDHLPAARIHAHIALARASERLPERLPEPATSTFAGVTVPRLDVPVPDGTHDTAGTVTAWLRAPWLRNAP